VSSRLLLGINYLELRQKRKQGPQEKRKRSEKSDRVQGSQMDFKEAGPPCAHVRFAIKKGKKINRDP